MTLAQEARSPTRRRTAGPVLRLVAAALLMGGWAVHLVTSFVGGYETVPWLTLEHEKHQVTSMTVVSSDPAPGGPWWTATDPGTLSDPATEGQPWKVVYTVADGQRVRVADPHHGAFGPPSSTSGWSSEPTGEELRDTLLARDLPAVGTARMPPAWHVSQVSGLALALGTLALVVAGPRPVHGNRWFWFWLVQMPAGLGVLAYAVYELGGHRHARAAGGLRVGGGWGVLYLLSGYVVVSVVGGLLALLLGTTVVPL
ncbi:hypothetical protein [Ornithinimicrobium pekingense]|uniref:DUF3592 domain-containing protein n=1 Tax=Ornithinimicrobium pekingense TaxID=384677 RepID=A0ABQ2FAT2_9MICO|nr:hypothetical protein [Ornithinimicrobium pekingense]GGK74047.1 hypothetical protein GCM10011509_23350 [Ornithinimicrobium pekingense]